MVLKNFNPVTPSRRELVQVDKSSLWKGRPLKILSSGLKKTGGRNNLGRTTCWNKSGGHKKLYREIDFKRSTLDMPAIVERIEYDPNRSSYIALIKYTDGKYSYILAPQKLSIGDTVISSSAADIKPGNALPLINIPVGTVVHNIELKPGKGGQLVRSAGTSAQVLGKEGKYVLVRLNSGEVRMILSACRATIGQVGNEQHELINIGKAGRSRWMRKRPTVRGSVMNPNDHPHGGGEGKAPIGRKSPMTPWGKPTLGKKTRKKTNKSDKFIVRRRKK